MELIVEGVSSIQNGASPRMLVERLEAWLDPARRVGYQARAKGGAAAA
jgi:flagellar motor component MotA